MNEVINKFVSDYPALSVLFFALPALIMAVFLQIVNPRINRWINKRRARR